MNKRRNKIFFDLINCNDYLRIDELATEYNVSNRTIRNDLLEIDNVLIKNNFKPIERNHSKGARMIVSEELLEFYKTMNGNDFYLKGIEIQTFIYMKLLFEYQYVDQDFFYNVIDASKSTIYASYKTVPDYFRDKHDLTVVKNEFQSYKIEGRFIPRLNVFLENLLENIEISKFYECVFYGKEYKSSFFQSVKENILNIDDYLKFKDIIKEIEKFLSVSYDDASYIRLLIFFDYVRNVSLFVNEDCNHFEKTNEFAIAKNILIKHFNVSEKKNCNTIVNLLTEIILTNKVIHSDFSNGIYEDITNSLVEQVEKKLNTKFKNREQLKINVEMHLKPMLYRVLVHQEISNPLFEEIINNYSDLYCAVDDACLLLKKYGYEHITPQEVSYLTVHFLSFYHTEDKIKVKKEKVLIVSAEGNAVSLNLKYMIRQYFELDYVECISLREFSSVDVDKYDAIITTTYLQILDKKIIRISPNFTNTDVEKLNKHFKRKHYETDLSIVHEIIKIAKRYCTIKDITGFQKEIINALVNENRLLTMNHSSDEVMFEKEFISFDSKPHDIYEAIGLAAKVLEDKNYINKSYELRIKSNIKELGGYMVIAPGVMLAHAGVDDGVNVSSFSILINEKGYELKNRFGNNVQVVMILAISDEHKYLYFLKKIIEIINDEVLVNKMIKSKSKSDIFKIFQ